MAISTPKSCWIAALFVLVATGVTPTARAQPEATFRIANVRVFDGERVQQNVDVAVEEGVIRAIGSDLAQWDHLPVVDGGGGTLLPGLIDAHVHTRSADELRQALRFGVTTVLDLGALIEPPELFELRDAAAAASDMADLRVAGFLASARSQEERGGPTLPSNPQVATLDDARRFVADRRAEGANHLKIVLRGVQSADRGVPNLDEARVRNSSRVRTPTAFPPWLTSRLWATSPSPWLVGSTPSTSYGAAKGRIPTWRGALSSAAPS